MNVNFCNVTYEPHKPHAKKKQLIQKLASYESHAISQIKKTISPNVIKNSRNEKVIKGSTKCKPEYGIRMRFTPPPQPPAVLAAGGGGGGGDAGGGVF